MPFQIDLRAPYTGAFSGSFTGSLIGSASYAASGTTSVSASFVSGAYTANWAATSPYGGLTNVPIGIVSSSTQFSTGSYTGSFTGSYTGTFIGSASFATNANAAITTSFVSGAYTSQWAWSSSYATTSSNSPSFVVGTVDVGGSNALRVSGSVVSDSWQFTVGTNNVASAAVRYIGKGGDPNSIYYHSLGNHWFAANGTLFWQISSAGMFTPNLDVTYNIGSATKRVLSGSFGYVTSSFDGDGSRIINTPSASYAASSSAATSITFTPISASYAATASAANNFYVGNTAQLITGLFGPGGSYQQISVTQSAYATYNGTTDIQPTTIPGSGIAKYLTRFRSPSFGAGTTQHDVIIDGVLSGSSIIASTITGNLVGTSSYASTASAATTNFFHTDDAVFKAGQGVSVNGARTLAFTSNVLTTINSTLTVTGSTIFSSSVNTIGKISGNGKEMFDTGDSYLRINQPTAFSSGIWIGTSNFQGGGGYFALGSNGISTTARVYIQGGAYTGATVITINSGDTGAVKAVSFTSSIANGVGYFGTSSYAANSTVTTNVSGSGGRVLFNSADNVTNTSSSLLFDGVNLTIAGQLNALTKSFLIDYQGMPNKKLVYGVVEGPEHSVFVRGKTTSNIIELPDEWKWLVDDTTITVQLTAIGSHQRLYVQFIENNSVTIANDNIDTSIDCFYYIHATRKDVPMLETVV
jgi:hypothetical protein